VALMAAAINGACPRPPGIGLPERRPLRRRALQMRHHIDRRVAHSRNGPAQLLQAHAQGLGPGLGGDSVIEVDAFGLHGGPGVLGEEHGAAP
jgi:hypothetical protein